MKTEVEIFKLEEKIFMLDRKFKNMLKYTEMENRELTSEETSKANGLLYAKAEAEEKLKELLKK